MEVIQKISARIHSLCPNTGSTWPEILCFEVRQQPLQGRHERIFIERAPELSSAGFPISPGHFPESRITQRVCRIHQTEIGLAVTLPLESEHGVRARFHSSGDHAGKV